MSNNTDTLSMHLPKKRVTGNTVEEKLTENAHDRILPARYLIKDENGDVKETPKEMFERVAKNVAQPDKEYEDTDFEESWQEFFNLMTDLKFMPNSPTLMNAGADLQQLSACFVAHPKDDMDSIFNTVHDAAKIFQSGGGMGYPFHLLRPKGDQVASTGGIASGPMTFQQVFDTMCGTIKQGGKRRGAQMGIMRVDHPDVLRFIVSKRKEGNLSNFNISVGITEDFMEAVENDEEYELINPRTGDVHEVTEKTSQFYNSDEEWYPEAAGSDQGKDDNFWRDFASSFGEEIQEFDIDLEPGEDMTLPARFIWETLVDGAWRNGEPGLFMYDETNEMHSFDVEKHPEHRIEATNPCVTGDALISTDQGVFTAEELYNQKIAADVVFDSRRVVVDSRRSSEKIKEASSVYKTGTKDVFKLETEEGFELRLTADHQVMTENNGWKEAQNLEEGDKVHILDREGSFGHGGTEEEGKVLGWLVGDGQMKQSEERAVLHFYDQKTEISEQFAGYANEVVRAANGNADYEIGVQQIQRREGHRQRKEAKEERVKSERLYELAEQYGLSEEKLQVPEKVFRSSKELARGFLQGLFTADGSVQGSVEKGVSVRLSSSDKELLKDTQQLLLNFGIYSKVYTERREAGKRELPDGKGGKKEYDVKAQHDLVISKGGLEVFREKIGFLIEDKEQKLEEKLSNYTRGPYEQEYTATVENLEEDGREDVYDLTEPDTHSFVANGLVVHNCGEQPLENYEACNLGHINLSLLVEDDAQTYGQYMSDIAGNPAEPAATKQYVHDALDLEELERIAKTGTRFLDNVVTMSDFPLEEIEDKVSSMRKVGLGLMGFAQMLIQMGVRYGSEESYIVAEEVQRLITKYSVEASHELAKERGEFSEWENSKWASPTEYSDWFERYSGGMNPENHKDGFKLRNHNTTTIAPTGTTSMIGNTSGGCEPIYNLAYFKNVAKDIQGEDMLVEFDDYFLEVIKASDADVEEVKQDAKQKMQNNEWEGVESISDDVLSPEIKELFVTADKVKPEEHIQIQAAFQYNNHSGISKTCNFPNSATKEDVREAYKMAYDKGVKGMTVYRDGTRDTQVMQTNKENKKTEKKDVLEWVEDAELAEVKDVIEQAHESAESEMVKERVEDESEEAEAVSLDEAREETGENVVDERPNVISGTTQEIETAYGDLYVTVNDAEGNGPFEVFCRVGKSGGYTQSFTEAIGRLSSLALRTGADAEDVVDQLSDIRSPQVSWDNGEQVHSIPDAVATALDRHMNYETKGVQKSIADDSYTSSDTRSQVEKVVDSGENPECPECGDLVQLQEGCQKCSSCGWSKC